MTGGFFYFSKGEPQMKNRLRAVREAVGLTQLQLAQRAELPLSTVQQIDAIPTRAIPLHSAVRLGRALHCDLIELLPAQLR